MILTLRLFSIYFVRSTVGPLVNGANKPNTAEHLNSNTQLVQNNLDFRSQSTRAFSKRRAAELNPPQTLLSHIVHDAPCEFGHRPAGHCCVDGFGHRVDLQARGQRESLFPHLR